VVHLNASPRRRKLFITDVRAQGNPTLRALAELRKRYESSQFEDAKTIEEAEIVLYVESGYVGFADLRRLVRRVRDAPSAMHFIFSESDWPLAVLPGAYPSMSKPCPWGHGWSFLPSFDLARNEPTLAMDAEPEFLFSFLGRVATHPVRTEVVSLDSGSTPCLDVADGPARFPSFEYSRTYAELLGRSRFVLCPRGFGASSIRTFEAMSLGRVPVIISDAWQPPPGIPWQELSVVIRERDVAGIPGMLEKLESRASAMGRLARTIFDQHFAPGIFLDRLLDSLITRYAGSSVTPRAICWRACCAAGWREIRTLCHQARAWANPAN
jgi:hypothetical protein